jgi:plasmid stabilization system protein ParE
LERAFALIAAQPRVGAIARNTRLADVRRLHLARVHYHLYYRVGRGAIEVIAFWHTSRGEAPPI